MIEFEIDCIPPKATAQQKGIMVRGGRPHFFEKKKVRESKDMLSILMRPHVPSEPLDGPLRLTVVWTYPFRASEPKKNRLDGPIPCDTKPDIDNLSKSFCDVMTKLGFWKDDSQVYQMLWTKRWGDKPGIRVTVSAPTR